ncbi:hypothetical protein AYI70_g5224 [Smittium culicis]|uniref:Uncharacterized protein n=1 Tax=Smittium culicis TaxID=133412 RepID=A0A1R1XVN4_9FUNG|nr:hypothetical protein AYI70_g5224 [Smittium culicis]
MYFPNPPRCCGGFIPNEHKFRGAVHYTKISHGVVYPWSGIVKVTTSDSEDSDSRGGPSRNRRNRFV